MPLQFNDYQQPDFLLCEIPVKDKSFNDDRLWVYSRLSLSLIEFICLNDIEVSNFQNTQKKFTFFDEQWIGVFVQNNCEPTDNDPNEILNQAWEFFRDYLAWEDVNILNQK